MSTTGALLVDAVRRAIHGRAPDANIFFMHLPKCGGDSVNHAISRCYAGRKPVTWLSPWASTRGAGLAGKDEFSLRRDLLLYQMSNQREGYISGHYPFSVPAWEAYGDRWRHVTVLRNPVERWFSQYFYNRYKTNSDYYRVTEELSDFAATDRAASWGREYVRFLSAANDVGEASDNLDRFDVIGATEDLDTFANTFDATFGVRLALGRRNASPATNEQRSNVSDDVAGRVQAICEPDMRIYQRAVESAALQSDSRPTDPLAAHTGW